jgi:bacterial/archaeal transporter family-2 protein
MNLLPLLLVAALIGALLPVQAGVNAQLRLALSDPVATALASFLVGAAGLAAALTVLRGTGSLGMAWARSDWWHWTGGLLGAVYIVAAVVLAPRLGAAVLTAAVVAGQMAASVALDHYGLVGFSEHPISLSRVAGAGLVILGVVLVQR